MYSIKSEWELLELIESDLRKKEKDSICENLFKKFIKYHDSALDLQVLINQLNVNKKENPKLKKEVYDKTTILCENIRELFTQLYVD